MFTWQRLHPQLNEKIVMHATLSIPTATPAENHTIAHRFGVARSAVCEMVLVHRTRLGIFESLMSPYNRAPTGSQLEGVTKNLMKWGVPQCVGQ